MQPYIENEDTCISQTGIHFFRQYNKPGKACFSAHIHSAVEILFIESGTFRVFSEDEENIVRAGDVVLFRSNTVHYAYAFEDGGVYHVLKFHPSYLYDISFRNRGSQYLLNFVLNRNGKQIVWTKEQATQNGIADNVKKLINESDSPSWGFDIAMKIYASGIILALLRDMENNNSDADSENITRTICDAMLYINEHYSENISAQDCAERFYMSYSYFSRSFCRITGKNFRTYLNSVRIDHAERSLLFSELPITDIAASCGFGNVSYFISLFRKRNGITPLEFRKSGRFTTNQNN